jgi:hypothetical protein
VVTVSQWRSRFALLGVRGLPDNLRPGKPPKYGTAFRDRWRKLLEQPPPEGYSHWEGPLVAEPWGASVHAVWRVLRREGIYLQVEILFSIYGRRTLRGASFESIDQLRVAIQAYLARHNQKPKPFRWCKRGAKDTQLRNTIVNLCN